MSATGRFLRRLLFWFRITDSDHVLSLTHAFLVVTVVVYWRHPDAITAAAAAAAVANYSAKNVIRRRDDAKAAPAPDLTNVNAVTALAADVEGLKRELAGFKSAAAIASLRPGR